MKIATLLILLALLPAYGQTTQQQIEALVKKKAEIKARIQGDLDEIEKLQKEINEIAEKADGVAPEPEKKGRFLPPFLKIFEDDKNHFQLRQSVKDKNKNGEPALVQYTHPSGGSDSWSIDVGGKFSRDIGGSARIGALAEYHYNSASSQLKDTFLGQSTFDWLIGNSSDNAQMLGASLGYKRDNLVAGDSVLGGVNWFPYWKDMYIGNRWRGWLADGRIEPLLGAEYESGNGAQGFVGGDRFSLRAGVSLNADLLPKVFGNRLETGLGFQTWHHPHATGVFDGYDHLQHYFSGSLTYWLNSDSDNDGKLGEKEKHFGITIRYERGDQPDEGQLNTRVWTFGFSAMF